MPDVLHWLGMHADRPLRLDVDMKYDAIVRQGIEIGERVSIPAELVPPDAQVELEAKKAAGYYSPELPKPQDLTGSVGRSLDKY